MRIAHISTPFVAVPPATYGGTELIVAELVQGLSAAGHEVLLFATGDSQVPVEASRLLAAPAARGRIDVHALYPRACWPPDPRVERDHAAWAVAQLAVGPRCDVVHAHLPAVLPLARYLDVPVVYTIHHARDERSLALYHASGAQLVTISARQQTLLPELSTAVIHHGLSPARYPLGHGGGGYVAFLGRLSRDKGVHVAVDVAGAAGWPIRVAGRPHQDDHDYFREELEPRFQRRGVLHVGEVGLRAKRLLLGGARALLFPVDWEEPFGLVMVEAMLCGTPVLALPRGSVPEVIDEGITGFVCRDAAEMVRCLGALDGFDRRRCRARAIERWSAARMVADHVALYRQLLRWVPDVRAADTLA